MERVLAERPVSPSTTNRSSTNSSNSCNSRDYGKPRRSYYRLFPSVEPTPPASPASLHHHQRASLRNSSAGGSCRRRSSSEDNNRSSRGASKDTQLAPHVLSSLAVSPLKEGRKGSLQALSPLRAVQENGYFDVVPETELTTLPNASEVVRAEPESDSSYNVFDSARLGEPTEACNTSADVLANRGYEGPARPQGFAIACPTAAAFGLGLAAPPVSPTDQGHTHIHTRTKPRPKLRIAIVQPREEIAPSRSAPHSRGGSGQSSPDGSMHSPFLVQDRSTAREVRVSPVAQKGELKVRELTVTPPSTRLAASKSAGIADKPYRPASPPALQESSGGHSANTQTLRSRFNSRAASPESCNRPMPLEHYAGSARPATSQGPATIKAIDFAVVDQPGYSRAAIPDVPGLSALAAARANVAALNDLEMPIWTPSFSEQSKTPGSDIGTLTARKFSQPNIADPVQTLAELGEQCEILHARHANLRAQRQQLSSSIIANIKGHKSGPDCGDMLLDEQLSLAAVGSAIDICFAKLKSLECRREDAITTLIAQASGASRAQSADTSRMHSLAPSFDSAKGLTTGRSTPDLHSLYHATRPGPPTKSYSYRTEAEHVRTKLPLSSLANEIGTEDSDNRARQPKYPAQMREPPATPESSYETAGASSTAGETDDTQTSDPSDIEDILPEERVAKPTRADAKCYSPKAAKILGIGLDNGPISPPRVRGSEAKKKTSLRPNLELHRLDALHRAEMDNASPMTASTLSPEGTDRLARDLELQIQSFPSAPLPAAPDAPAEANRNHITNPQDSPMISRRDTTKSYASAHTINVYFEGYGPHEDLPFP